MPSALESQARGYLPGPGSGENNGDLFPAEMVRVGGGGARRPSLGVPGHYPGPDGTPLVGEPILPGKED